MDECSNLVWIQVTTMLVVTVDQNCLYVFEYCLCIWQGREGTVVCYKVAHNCEVLEGLGKNVWTESPRGESLSVVSISPALTE